VILTLAVQGKLVPQDPGDEPASVLLQKIRAENDRLIAAGKIKRDKPLPAPDEDEQPFEIPGGWEWVRFGDLAIISGVPDPRSRFCPTCLFTSAVSEGSGAACLSARATCMHTSGARLTSAQQCRQTSVAWRLSSRACLPSSGA
jgi:hypothetical protein